MADARGPVLAVTGLLAEARIAAAPGVFTVAGGGDTARLERMLRTALAEGARAMVSIGIAGGLEPGLRPGTVLLARTVRDGDDRHAADAAWLSSLEAALPAALRADLVGTDQPVCTPAEKEALRHATRAKAVDMESHVVARLAVRHGLPFAAVRVVSDPHDRALPGAATVGLRSDGTTDILAVLGALRRRPADLAPLVRAGLDARAAMVALRRCRRHLTSALSFPDGEEPRHCDLSVAQDRRTGLGAARRTTGAAAEGA